MKEMQGNFLHIEDRFIDVQGMSDEELNTYIQDMIYSCRDYHFDSDMNPTTSITLLQIAIAEKNSRAAAKQVEASNALAQEALHQSQETLTLTKTTIRLWWIAIILAACGLIVAIIGV